MAFYRIYNISHTSEKPDSGAAHDNDEGEGADSKKGGSADQQAQSTTSKRFTLSGGCELLIAIIIV